MRTITEMSLREMRVRHDELRRKNIPSAAEVIERQILAEEMERARAIEAAGNPGTRPLSGFVELDESVGAGLIIKLCSERLAQLYPQWEEAKVEARRTTPKPTESPAPGRPKVLMNGSQVNV
ncbi:MAG: hypothetical protein RMY34_23310 [Aulosira sp. DedQUE10]|nr:hypothetical protein [Aulosira sp. DedQUE10]